MFRYVLAGLALGFFVAPLHAKPFEDVFPNAGNAFNPDAIEEMSKLDYKTGKVSVGRDLATFDLGEDYYFLDADDANHVLVELWGNPPYAGTLGMIFPIYATPLDDTWGIEVTYEDIGYVSDEDAENYDYQELLQTMQADISAGNKTRVEQGYEAIELVGWAEKPHYDPVGRKLYWAQELAFDGSDSHTLNYNIRALGRQGVLVINFIADMDRLDDVRDASPDILNMVSFNPGNRYSDFDPSVDTVAAVGIGGLIAGKALTKTGFLAVALVFLKKFWFLALLPLVWLKNVVFKRRN